MNFRRWSALVVGLVLLAGAITLHWLPDLVRHLAIARIQALTGRPVSIDRIDLNVFTGRFAIRGFRLSERDGTTPFAELERLDASLRLPSLLLGHLSLRDLRLSRPTVHVVRLPNAEFNLSDLVRSQGTTGKPLAVTVDDFALTSGTVTLEDHAVPEGGTWTSENISIEARNLSTRRDDGSAVATSVTAGAPVSIELSHLRLYPIHLQGTVKVEGFDLTPARVYLPPDTSIAPGRGRVSTALTVTLDARDGVRADATARLEDVAVVRRAGGDLLALVPGMTTQVSGFAYREGDLRVGRLALDGTMNVRDPAARQGAHFRLATVRASVADLTWPTTTPGQLDLSMNIPGAGTLAVTGALQAPPAPSQLRVRLADLALGPWAQFLPVTGKIAGVAEADLRVNEPLAAGIPARVQGTAAVNHLEVADAGRTLLGARRVEARGIEVRWPRRVVVRRVLVTRPRAIVERDRAGGYSLAALVSHPAPTTTLATGSARSSALGVDVWEIVVRDGALAWRDQLVSPPARLDISGLDASVTGVGWPLRGRAGVRAALRPPGGGQLRLTGQVGLDPLSADLRVAATNADLAPYQPYLRMPARISGAADLDVAVVAPDLTDGRATVRGRAALLHMDVRDRERTVLRVERAGATGLDVDWPGRIAVERLTLRRPWVLVERDDKGALPLRALLTPRPAPSAPGNAGAAGPAEPLAVTVTRLSVDRGGARIVDRAVSPPFAVDFQPVMLRLDGISTAPGKTARIDVSGQLGPSAELVLSGTIGSIGGPLRFDVTGELRGFAVPRTNPYLLQQVGWKSTEGRLASRFRCSVNGDSLSARTDIRLSQLQVIRAGPYDGAQARIGLPLGMITSLMKDRRGDINLSLPVGGRLSDPRFDYREALWGAIRAVAVKAITLPVSWIGHVRFTSDSRIEHIEVNPVRFEGGTSTLTPEGQQQAARLAAFLGQLPEVKLALTPVVSSNDVEEIKRRAVETAIEQTAREERLSGDAAAARLFEKRVHDRPAPPTREAIVATLLEREPIPASAVPELASRRLEAVRATVKQAGVDPARLPEMKPVQRQGAQSEVALDVVEPGSPHPSKVKQVLRKLGLPLSGSGAED